MVLRKKEIKGRERTASVSSLEEWCKETKATDKDSKEKTNTEGQEWVFKNKRRCRNYC